VGRVQYPQAKRQSTLSTEGTKAIVVAIGTTSSTIRRVKEGKRIVDSVRVAGVRVWLVVSLA
jgi:hypothetical protein